MGLPRPPGSPIGDQSGNLQAASGGLRTAKCSVTAVRRRWYKRWSGRVWWAREELNLRPLPCQIQRATTVMFGGGQQTVKDRRKTAGESAWDRPVAVTVCQPPAANLPVPTSAVCCPSAARCPPGLASAEDAFAGGLDQFVDQGGNGGVADVTGSAGGVDTPGEALWGRSRLGS
jgi:hypothetical protein